VTRVGGLRSWWRLACLGLWAALLSSAACAGLSHASRPFSPTRFFSTTATLRSQPFELHLAAPSRPRVADALVLYASGDGGWFGAAVDMFHVIGDAGFYAVGLSSRTLLHHTPGGQPLTIADISEDYQAILVQASEVLHLPPQRRAILTGWSRGASLAVLVGGARHAPSNLAGVVAIGLAEEENLGVPGDTDDDPEDKPMVRDASSLDMYALIAQVAPRRSAVIQATGDRYLQASRARELFGPDTDVRRFFEVVAKNHRFGGADDRFVTAIRGALDWIAAP
jgi:fermentation-respiration switch protein FrsA (DUF1100 family)